MKYDHSTSYNVSEKEYKDLAALGFNLPDHSVEHPGGHVCRFIVFPNKQYLEFVEIKKEEGSDQKPEVSSLALQADVPLKALFPSIKDEFSDYKPVYEHRNYDWKRDSTSLLPGWNFLNFDRQLVEGISIWFVEYEEPRNKSKSLNFVPHPNTVNTIVGALWRTKDLDELKAFERLTKCRREKDRLVLSESFSIWLDRMNTSPTKISPHVGMVLKADNLEEFKRVSGCKQTFDFFGREAVRIPLNRNAYDLIIVGE